MAAARLCLPASPLEWRSFFLSAKSGAFFIFYFRYNVGMKLARKIGHFFANNQYIWYFFIFILAFFVFGFLQSQPLFMDPDSFYHAKMAVLIRDHGPILNFPWLPFTVLKNYYIDQHFLYHILLIPFITILDPLVGLKLATVFFVSLFFIVFYWFLKRNQIYGALFFTLFLFLCKPLVFRINLAKVPAVSLIFLLIGFYLIINKKYWHLFLFSFLYVYLYGGWPLIIVVLFFYYLVSVIADYLEIKKKRFQLIVRHYLSRIREPLFDFYLFISIAFSRRYWKLIGACLSGLAAGLVFNPYFPKNLRFYWYQFVQIGIINLQGKVRVGMEWLPYQPKALLLDNCLLLILLFFALVIFVFNIKKQNRLVWVNFLLAFFFLVITFKSQRYIEYFIPFAVIFSALVFGPFLAPNKLRAYFNWWRNKSFLKTFMLSALVIFWATAIAVITMDATNLWYLYQKSGIPFKNMQAAAGWMSQNIAPGQIIFHSDWDEFPTLFYYNSNNYYIAGLDPTFMYSANPVLYKIFENITVGNLKINLARIIKDNFNTNYVFVNKTDHQNLVKTFDAADNFKPIYEDNESKIYYLLDL